VYQFEIAWRQRASFHVEEPRSLMTFRQYNVIEQLLDQAVDVTMEHPLLTPQGRRIQALIRELQVKVEAEKIRAADRESADSAPAKNPA